MLQRIFDYKLEESKLMIDNCVSVIQKSKEAMPLVHCLTNPITSYVCAGMILAAGGRPIMAEHPREVEEITAQADALLINLGNISDSKMDAMRLSAVVASEKGIPIVLDAVGVGCSHLRLKFAFQLLKFCKPAILKGNRSEIIALCLGDTTCRGVDAEAGDLEASSRILAKKAQFLAKQYGTVVMVSGPTDIIASQESVFRCENGTPLMGKVCGTGCMLGALAAAYSSRNQPIPTALTAVLAMGIAGERASCGVASGSFPARLLDEVSGLCEESLRKQAKFYRMEAQA